MRIIAQPFSDLKLGDVLNTTLSGERGAFNSFKAAVAFAKLSGIQHISEALNKFNKTGAEIELVIGVDQQGTSADALDALMKAVGSNGRVLINHDQNSYVTYHPKLYLFEGETVALAVVGSGNLTEGGVIHKR